MTELALDIASAATATLFAAACWADNTPAGVRAHVERARREPDHLPWLAARLPALGAGPAPQLDHDAVVAACRRHGIQILSPLDAEYPPRLAAIADYPGLLYVKGEVAALRQRSIAVVGTRQASVPGRAAAERIARHLVQRDVAVVSGLAYGIDGAAHAATVAARGVGIVVLAHGLDMVYPADHQYLADQVLACGGAWLSEHPPGVRPDKLRFVLRNRLQSGLAGATVVVESGVPGGTLHTARYAHAQGRPLYVVAPSAASLAVGHDVRGADHLRATVGAATVAAPGDLDAAIAGVAW